MTAKYSFGLVLLAGAAWAADAVPPLDVRPGMWESTMTTKMSGAPPIPPELLAKMTPEQKAALEARMKTRESQSPKTTVGKQCLTKEELKKPLKFGDENGSCQRTVVNASSSKQEIRIQCSNAGIKASGTIRIEAIDPEHMKFSSQMTSGDGSRAMSVDVTGVGKWLSAACGGDAEK
jgi:hypothetical protein